MTYTSGRVHVYLVRRCRPRREQQQQHFYVVRAQAELTATRHVAPLAATPSRAGAGTPAAGCSPRPPAQTGGWSRPHPHPSLAPGASLPLCWQSTPALGGSSAGVRVACYGELVLCARIQPACLPRHNLLPVQRASGLAGGQGLVCSRGPLGPQRAERPPAAGWPWRNAWPAHALWATGAAGPTARRRAPACSMERRGVMHGQHTRYGRQAQRVRQPGGARLRAAWSGGACRRVPGPGRSGAELGARAPGSERSPVAFGGGARWLA